ncbi:Mitotic exit network component [Cladochytrium tenue]|nr:Mitotic exit network component [Cladochytrium tenue]
MFAAASTVKHVRRGFPGALTGSSTASSLPVAQDAGPSGSSTSSSASRDEQLRRYAEATLGEANLRVAVRLPDGEDPDEWLAVHVVDFVGQAAALYACLAEACSARQCPVMSAGPKFEYLWADGATYKKPTKVSAPAYIELLMSWINAQLDDPTLFPTVAGQPFPLSFTASARGILRRLFRVYAHIYHSHFARARELGVDAHLNTSFRHFVLFVDEFHLVDRKEMAPLEDLVATILDGDDAR